MSAEVMESPPVKRYRPDHVPADKIISFDAYNDPRMKVDPLGTLIETYRQEPVYWNDIDAGFKRGCWVVTRAEDIRNILLSPDFHNNNYVNLQALAGEHWPLIPTGIDGDLHKKYRAVMAPWFTPQALTKYNEFVSQRASDLADKFVDRGRCEFMDEFGVPFPITIVLDLLGLPQSRMPEFLEWEYDMVSGSDFGRAAVAIKNVLQVLRELIADRRANPRNDLSTTVVQAEVDARKLNDDECMGMLLGLYLGGLDTVATSLSLHFRELAVNQELQARLRANPDKIPAAIEEMLRRFSPVSPRRQAQKDVELHGVTIKAGDWVQLPTALGGTDPRDFSNPLAIDIDRQNKRHFAFVTGAHFCLGHTLARRELQVAYQLWLTRIPQFRIADPAEVTGHGGMTVGYRKLPLAWD